MGRKKGISGCVCEVRVGVCVCVFDTPPFLLTSLIPVFRFRLLIDIPSPFWFLGLLFVVLRSGEFLKDPSLSPPSRHWHKVKYVNLMKKPKKKKG